MWYPTTCFGDETFFTYKDKLSHTAIDTIVFSKCLADFVTLPDTLRPLKYGHSCLICRIPTGQTNNAPTWEIQQHDTAEIDNADVEWLYMSDDFYNCYPSNTVEEDWQEWCSIFTKVYRIEFQKFGCKPHFRLRDEAKSDRLVEQMHEAIYSQNHAQIAHIQSKLHTDAQARVRKWQKQVHGRNMKHHQWMRSLFQWIKGGHKPMPACIESVQFGENGFTTCLADSLKETSCFFRNLFKHDEFHQKQQVMQTHTDLHVSRERVLAEAEMLRALLDKADPNKAHGLDGLKITHFKKLPPEAVKMLAMVFIKAKTKHMLPSSWLMCRLTCIPKRAGNLKVRDLRPLTIAPVAYRFFCKWLLAQNAKAQLNIDSDSVGGVPGRDAIMAWVPAVITVENS